MRLRPRFSQQQEPQTSRLKVDAKRKECLGFLFLGDVVSDNLMGFFEKELKNKMDDEVSKDEMRGILFGLKIAKIKTKEALEDVEQVLKTLFKQEE